MKNEGSNLSAKKCEFFLTSVTCGRIIDAEGETIDPSRLSGLQSIHVPQTAGELCEYVYCLQWMSGCIPDFAERVAPLRAILEEAYNIKGSRKKRAIQNTPLSHLAWGADHESAFQDTQYQIQQSIKLSHRKSEMELCVFTDASDKFWAEVVTQFDPKELKKPHSEQRHEPLAFLSSSFNKTQCSWSTFEKEAFSILKVFQKMDYLLLAE